MHAKHRTDSPYPMDSAYAAASQARDPRERALVFEAAVYTDVCTKFGTEPAAELYRKSGKLLLRENLLR